MPRKAREMSSRFGQVQKQAQQLLANYEEKSGQKKMSCGDSRTKI